MNEERQRFLALDAEVQGHIHAGLRSIPTYNKSFMRRYRKRLVELQDLRDKARDEWRKVDVPLSYVEKLKAAANGHDDLASTQAARRLCLKKVC